MSIIPSNYAQTFAEIKQLVIQARHQTLYKVNIELITMYINLGQKILVQTQQGRGDRTNLSYLVNHRNCTYRARTTTEVEDEEGIEK